MKQYTITVPKSTAFTIKTPDDFIQLHSVTLAVAKRGCGKTCAISNLLHMMKKNDVLDRLILVSPTYENNKHYFEGLPLDRNDIIEPEMRTAERLIDLLEQAGKEYDEYIEAMRLWNQLQADIRNRRKHIHEIDEDLMLKFIDMKKPEYKYMRNGKPYKPVTVCFFDDCQGSDLFKPKSKLSNMVIKHRHLGQTQHGSLGCTLIFACQNYTSSSAGLPKSIRGNLTHMMVFRNKNMRELALISEEASGEISVNQFFDLYDRAMEGSSYNFLFIDFAKKQQHPSMFRKNFNEWLTPS